MVDGNVAEPDVRSMRELKDLGMIDPKMVKEENPDFEEGGPEHYYYLGQIGDDEVDPNRQREGMHYDNEVIFDDDVGAWIQKCVERPFKLPRVEEASGVARMMRILQPEVFRGLLERVNGSMSIVREGDGLR